VDCRRGDILQNWRFVATMARIMSKSAFSDLPPAYMRYLFPALMAICLASPETLRAQTIVPKLDTPGQKGDIARAQKKRAEERFDGFDKDKDGKLSREEVAGNSAYLTENFDKLDANKDGFLSWEEFLGHNRWPK
jgi:hypothetical protein